MGTPEEKTNGLEMDSKPSQQNGKQNGEVRPKTPPAVVTPESEAERRKQEKIKKKPLLYCRMVTNHPKVAFCEYLNFI